VRGKGFRAARVVDPAGKQLGIAPTPLTEGLDMKLVGVIVLVAGILSLIYGGFSYTEERHDVDFGPVEFQVEEKEHVNVPAWAGAGAVILGTLLIAVGKR
jgi:hypothetical protein